MIKDEMKTPCASCEKNVKELEYLCIGNIIYNRGKKDNEKEEIDLPYNVRDNQSLLKVSPLSVQYLLQKFCVCVKGITVNSNTMYGHAKYNPG